MLSRVPTQIIAPLHGNKNAENKIIPGITSGLLKIHSSRTSVHKKIMQKSHAILTASRWTFDRFIHLCNMFICNSIMVLL